MMKPRAEMTPAENAAMAVLHGIRNHVDKNFMRTRDVFVAVDTDLTGKITADVLEKAMDMLHINVITEDDALEQVSYDEILDVLNIDAHGEEEGVPTLDLSELDKNMKEFRVAMAEDDPAAYLSAERTSES